MQVTVKIPDEQMSILSDMVSRFGVQDQKELINLSVDDFIRRYHDDPLGRAFGLWRGRGITDGVEFQNKIRDAWNSEYDEAAF